MKKTLFVVLIGALVLGFAVAMDNTPAYNWGFTYGTQGNNQCGTSDATGQGAGYKSGTESTQNKRLEDCNKGYVDGYNATHGSGTSTSSDSSNNGQ